jgi:hypothetical protein
VYNAETCRPFSVFTNNRCVVFDSLYLLSDSKHNGMDHINIEMLHEAMQVEGCTDVCNLCFVS